MASPIRFENRDTGYGFEATPSFALRVTRHRDAFGSFYSATAVLDDVARRFDRSADPTPSHMSRADAERFFGPDQIAEWEAAEAERANEDQDMLAATYWGADDARDDRVAA